MRDGHFQVERLSASTLTVAFLTDVNFFFFFLTKMLLSSSQGLNFI